MSIRIKELRLERNLTLLEVAKRLGVSESTVQRYESGAIATLKYDTIIDLSNLFSVDPCYLMGWESSGATDDLVPQLSDDEMRILELYRSLNAIGKRKAIENLEDLSQIERYTRVAESTCDAV